MSSEIWVSVLALAGTIVGSFSGVIISNKLVNFRLSELEKRVEKLIQLSERVALVERDVAAVMVQVKDVKSLTKPHITMQDTAAQ